MRKDSVQIQSVTKTGRPNLWTFYVNAEYNDEAPFLDTSSSFALNVSMSDIRHYKQQIVKEKTYLTITEGPNIGKKFLVHDFTCKEKRPHTITCYASPVIV
jgi:hypothetical protein